MTKRVVLAAATALALAPVANGFAPSDLVPSGSVDHAVFDRILRENVRGEDIDYLSIRLNHWCELRDYLNLIARTEVEELSRDEQLALYINLYNATMIQAVIERYKIGYSTSGNDFGLFKEKLVRLKGRTLSLNDLENAIIRPTFSEPRVHVALVCAAKSCPSILPRAYRAGDLDDVLEAGMRRFVNDSKRNRLDSGRNRTHLSQIFNWYAEDFGGKGALVNYVSKYAATEVTGDKVEFLEYSWDLNFAPPRNDKWVAITSMQIDLFSQVGGDTVGTTDRDRIFYVPERRGDWLRVTRPFGAGEAWLKPGVTKPWSLLGE